MVIKILGDFKIMIYEKIFEERIDFSWRSFCSILRTTKTSNGGLRQYSQKDPLSEFKKEAFVLFESLF